MENEAVTAEQWPVYLVEGYRPGIPVEVLARAARRLRAAAEQMSREGKAVRYLRSTIVPEDESCLFLIEAASEDLVREAYGRAGVGFERISTAIPVEDVAREARGNDVMNTTSDASHHARPNENGAEP
jgi:hypothetical protein